VGWVALAVSVAATSGSTIPNIAAAPRTKTVQLRTDSAARRGAILLRTVRLALGNRLADRAAICPAIGQVERAIDQVERAIDQVVAVLAIEPGVESVPAIGPAAVELIA
jgi:hypothetical protein